MMKKHITILTFIFTLMFSSTSYSEWKKVTSNIDGSEYYLDLDRIRKVDGYVYYWMMADYLKPIGTKYFSAKAYYQGDCKLLRYMISSVTFHNEQMGRGAGDINNDVKIWEYPPPDSAGEVMLKSVCDWVK